MNLGIHLVMRTESIDMNFFDYNTKIKLLGFIDSAFIL